MQRRSAGPLAILASLLVVAPPATSRADERPRPNPSTRASEATAGFDNGRIAFSRGNGSDWDLYSVGPDGSGELQLSGGPDLDERATWSPDGTELLVTSEASVQTIRDVVYASPGGIPLRTDIYLPPAAFGGPRPGIVIPTFQGFLNSDKDHPGAPEVARSFARSGYVAYVFSVRVWPDGYLYPAAEDDANALVGWVRSNAAVWNTDSDRLGAFGGSGGGYLAAVLGYKGEGDLTTGTRVRAFAAWSSPFNLWQIPISSNNQRAAGYLGCDPQSVHATPECVQLGKDASPTEMVSPDDPPALIRNSTDESTPIEQPRSMKASLEAANIPIDYEEIEGDAHAYHLKKTEFAETLSFFDRNLLDPGESSVPLASGIYRIEGDGDGRTTVIDGSASERDPTWSPDGTAAVFASDVSGDQEIYSVALAGGDPFNFSLSPTSIDRQPAWSPDGSQVAFISDRLGSFDVFVAKANGSGATPLVKEGEGLANPSWSPDGQYIAFERRTEAGIDIFVIRVDGTGLVRLTDAAGHDRHPVWSPDGTRIAFSSERSGNGDIYTMAPDGTGVMLISGGVSPELYPSWQPIPSPLPDPGLTVGDVSVIEGNQGTVAAVFSLRLSRAVAWQAEAEYRTRKRFAIPGVDYTSVTGTVLFPPGETEGLVTVPVVGDLAVEANETFFLELSNPWGAVIDDGRGEGWIMDDDGPCVIRGTPGNDRLEGSSGPDYLCGFGGNDEIIGADGDDTISGGTGNDTLLGGAGADDVAGGEGGDRLSGEADDDTLTGGAGADVLQGGTEDDHLDTVDRIGGNDSADGGDGTDTARADPGDIVTNCP